MPGHDLTLKPATDPTVVYHHRDGLYAPDLLAAAVVWLDFFTWLAEHPSDKTTICRALQIHDRPTDVMLTLFVAMGFLQQEQNVFSLTPLAREHLVGSSPWFLGPYYAALKDRPVCKDFLTVLKTGKPANWGSLKSEKEWARAMEDETFAEQFTAAMDCRGVYLAQAVAKNLDCRSRTHLLDVAGGSGVYACAMVAHHSNLEATVLEKPPVDMVAGRAIARRGFADRVSVVAGDIFRSEWPNHCDLHLISNVLHDWDVPLARRILAHSFQALRAGGMVVVHDAFINTDKSGPYPVAAYSALLMHSTEGKCYSISEMETFLMEAGFQDPHYLGTAADRGIMTAVKP